MTWTVKEAKINVVNCGPCIMCLLNVLIQKLSLMVPTKFEIVGIIWIN